MHMAIISCDLTGGAGAMGRHCHEDTRNDMVHVNISKGGSNSYMINVSKSWLALHYD